MIKVMLDFVEDCIRFTTDRPSKKRRKKDDRASPATKMEMMFCDSRAFFFFVGFNFIFYVKQVDGMDVFAVKQACAFAKQHALKNGPIVSAYHPPPL